MGMAGRRCHYQQRKLHRLQIQFSSRPALRHSHDPDSLTARLNTSRCIISP
jgi:hypothetical protein